MQMSRNPARRKFNNQIQRDSMITKDGRDTSLEKLTPELYIVPKGEERFYHVLIEMTTFDQKTGKRLSRPRVQKFGKKIFDTHVRESLTKQGWTITILHDPTAWVEKTKAEKAAAAQADAEAKAKEEQAKIDAAVEAAVAKALAAERAKVAKEQAEKEAAEAEAAAKAAAEAEAEAAKKEETPSDATPAKTKAKK